MTIKTILSFSLLAVFALVANGADDKGAHSNSGGQPPALERFKQLSGEWVGKELEGGVAEAPIRVKYKVTANGSAVVETMFPDTDHEMITVIHPDGKELVLTHYCAVGNQPQMRAAGEVDGNKVAFKFARATNMKSDKDMHMHDATFTFVDKDTIQTTWTHFKDGKAAGKVVFELKRKK